MTGGNGKGMGETACELRVLKNMTCAETQEGKIMSAT